MDDYKKENVQRLLEDFLRKHFAKNINYKWNKTPDKFLLTVNVEFKNTEYK